MKIRKKKSFRRILQFYRVGFDVNPPYRVLLDGTFIHQAQKMKMNLREQLPKTLLAPATPVASSCVMHELRSFRHELIETVVVAKQFYRHKCEHAPRAQGGADTATDAVAVKEHENDQAEPSREHTESCEAAPGHEGDHVEAEAAPERLPGNMCILDLIGKTNPNHYVVATQDQGLKSALRQIPGVPLMYISGPGLTVEPPSTASRTAHVARESAKMDVASWEKRHLPSLRTEEAAASAETNKKRKRRGQNPLSCLPKKVTTESAPTKKRCRTKRKRDPAGEDRDGVDKKYKAEA